MKNAGNAAKAVSILADWCLLMARKAKNRNFNETLDALRSRGVEGTSFGGVPNGMQVSKNGVAAVLLPGETDPKWDSGGERLALTPGILVRGEIARLLDRGYQ